MFCWSYWQTVFTDIGRVPSKVSKTTQNINHTTFNSIPISKFQFKIPESEVEKLLSAENEEAQRLLLERFAQDLPVYNRYIFFNTKHLYRHFVYFNTH